MLLFLVQTVQAVQADQTPFFILPRVAGEERGEGLNGARRLNRAKRLNGLNDSLGDPTLQHSSTPSLQS
jgi:hypothetical protein